MAFVANDSFTTQARVEGICQRGTFDGTSNPTQQQVLDAMAMRGAEIQMAIVASGASYTVPSGGSAIPTGGTDGEKALARVLDLANAYLAAGDAREMHDARDFSGETPPWVSFWDEGYRQLERAVAFAASGSLGGVSASGTVRTATSTGGVPKADFPGTGETEISRADLFGINTKW